VNNSIIKRISGTGNLPGVYSHDAMEITSILNIGFSLDGLNGRVALSREMALGWSRTRLGMVRDRPPPAARDAFQLLVHCGFDGRKSDMLRYRETDGRRGSADFGFAQ